MIAIVGSVDPGTDLRKPSVGIEVTLERIPFMGNRIEFVTQSNVYGQSRLDAPVILKDRRVARIGEVANEVPYKNSRATTVSCFVPMPPVKKSSKLPKVMLPLAFAVTSEVL